MTKTFPKSAEGAIDRFRTFPETWENGIRNGGTAAIFPVPEKVNPDGTFRDVLCFQPDKDGEDWWEYLEEGMVIRTNPYKIANNKEDLMAHALVLKRQPSETQAAIGKKMVAAGKVEQKELEAVEVTEGDKLEEQLKQEVEKKQRLEKLKTYRHRVQYLIRMGEWLDKHETGLKLCQSQMGDAFFEWCEDDSPSADETLVQKTTDGFKYFIETIASLRQICGCPDKERDGTLYLTFPDGRIETILDLNDLQ